MKIVFSLYKEDYESAAKTLFFTKVVNTDLSLEQIDKILQVYDGFHSCLEGGQNILFWDIYSYFLDLDSLKERINSIPISIDNQPAVIERPIVLALEEFDPGSVSDPSYPKSHSYFLLQIKRYECGANSADAILWVAQFVSAHPILMIFISGQIWDTTKWLFEKISTLVASRPKSNQSEKVSPNNRQLFFYPNKFFRNFKRLTSIKKRNYQIVGLAPKKQNYYIVHVRTLSNERYIVHCTYNGKIISLKLASE